MRTLIFLLGFEFLELLAKHWDLYEPVTKSTGQFCALILVGCIVLDIFKK